jgi:hypothetical protein
MRNGSKHVAFEKIGRDAQYIGGEILSLGDPALRKLFSDIINDLIDSSQALNGLRVRISGSELIYEVEEGVKFDVATDGKFEEEGLYRGVKLLPVPIYVDGFSTGVVQEVLAHALEVSRTRESENGLDIIELTTVVAFPISTATQPAILDLSEAFDPRSRHKLSETAQEMLENMDIILWEEQDDLEVKIHKLSELLSAHILVLSEEELIQVVSYLEKYSLLGSLKAVVVEYFYVVSEDGNTTFYREVDGQGLNISEASFVIGYEYEFDGARPDAGPNIALAAVVICARVGSGRVVYIPLNQQLLLED